MIITNYIPDNTKEVCCNTYIICYNTDMPTVLFEYNQKLKGIDSTILM